jgi:hypothetical protein
MQSGNGNRLQAVAHGIARQAMQPPAWGAGMLRRYSWPQGIVAAAGLSAEIVVAVIRIIMWSSQTVLHGGSGVGCCHRLLMQQGVPIFLLLLLPQCRPARARRFR